MINIQMQLCGLMILGIITFIFCRLPKLNTRSQRVFFMLLVAGITCLVTDILSVVFIYFSESISDTFVKASCKVYLAFLMVTVYSGYLYICSDFCKRKKSFLLLILISLLALLPCVITMIVLPIEFYTNAEGTVVYSYGDSTNAAYVGFGATFTAMVVFLILGRKKINKRRTFSVAMWLTIMFAAALIQYFVKELLVVSFAATLGILIIFIMIENPGQSLDKASPFFHHLALESYMSERYINGKKFCLIVTRFYPAQIPEYMRLNGKKKDCCIFVGDNNLFVLTNTVRQAKTCLKLLDEIIVRDKIYYVENSDVVPDAKSLVYSMKTAVSIYRNSPDKICHIDEGLIDQIGNINWIKKLIDYSLENYKVEVFYQPIYSVKDKKFISAEALARLRDMEGNIVMPGRFIPVAESDGSIIRLGKAVLHRVCSMLSTVDTESYGLKYVEINLSVVQGEDSKLADEVMAILERYHLPTNKINLEITESASTTGREQLMANMNKLIQRGLEFSLDDFGTGQSNLDYMSVMPVKIVKFDRNMTMSYFESEKSRHIMNAAIRMIHDMGLSVVVEGIETEEQFKAMEKLGVSFIQGYYFSKPLPQDEFLEFLKQHNQAISE